MQVKIKKDNTEVKTPTYGTAGAACFDIYAYNVVNWLDLNINNYDIVPARDSNVFETGLSFEVPEGHVMLVFSRSSQGFKNDIRLANCVGVIDSDYRGKLAVKLTNDSDKAYKVYNGDRIAQAMVIPVEQVEFLVVDELSDTVRGEGGFGSTGR